MNVDICNRLDDLKGIMLNRRENSKGYILYDSTYITFSKLKRQRTDKWLPGIKEREEGYKIKAIGKSSFVVMKWVYILIVIVVIHICKD